MKPTKEMMILFVADILILLTAWFSIATYHASEKAAREKIIVQQEQIAIELNQLRRKGEETRVSMLRLIERTDRLHREWYDMPAPNSECDRCHVK